MNTPNILSLIRIILTPLFIILLFADFKMAKVFALLVFAIAAITDAYDGHLARKYNQITPVGKFLDPVADKILVLSAFISFAFINIIDFWQNYHKGKKLDKNRLTIEVLPSGINKNKLNFDKDEIHRNKFY